MIPLFCGWELMPDHRGRVTGVVACAFSLSPVIFNYLTFWLANPRNIDALKTYPGEDTKYYDIEVTDRVPMMLHGMAITLMILTLLGNAMIWTPEDIAESGSSVTQSLNTSDTLSAGHKGMEPLEIDSSRSTSGTDGKTEDNLDFSEIKKLVCSMRYLAVYVMFLGGLLMPQFMIIFFKTYGQTMGHDDQFLTTCGAVGSVSSAFAGLGFGYLAEKFSFRGIAVVLYTFLLGGSIALPLFATVKPIYFMLSVFILSCMGANGSIYPTELAKIYGNARGGILYGIINTGNVLSFIIIVGIVYMFHVVLGYSTIILILSGAVAIALLLVLQHSSHSIGLASTEELAK
jgi:MFS family permease